MDSELELLKAIREDDAANRALVKQREEQLALDRDRLYQQVKIQTILLVWQTVFAAVFVIAYLLNSIKAL